MDRDFKQFPSDENGEILWRLVEHGDDLTVPRDIDFSLDFHTEQAAMDCGLFLFRNEYKVQLEPPLEDDPDSPWTIQVMPYMVPEHARITHMESYLQDVARHFGGECTGWGCACEGAGRTAGQAESADASD